MVVFSNVVLAMDVICQRIVHVDARHPELVEGSEMASRSRSLRFGRDDDWCQLVRRVSSSSVILRRAQDEVRSLAFRWHAADGFGGAGAVWKTEAAD
jgi:hypothetical protein